MFTKLKFVGKIATPSRRLQMIEELKILAGVVDYPVIVLAFVWALRMIRSMHQETMVLLERCLSESYEAKN